MKDQGNLAALLILVVLTRAKRRRRQPEAGNSEIGQETPAEIIGTTRSRVNLYKSQCDAVRCDLVE